VRNLGSSLRESVAGKRSVCPQFPPISGTQLDRPVPVWREFLEPFWTEAPILSKVGVGYTCVAMICVTRPKNLCRTYGAWIPACHFSHRSRGGLTCDAPPGASEKGLTSKCGPLAAQGKPELPGCRWLKTWRLLKGRGLGIGRFWILTLVIGGLFVGGADGFAPRIGAVGVDVFILG
jgi:hypothetical protein